MQNGPSLARERPRSGVKKSEFLSLHQLTALIRHFINFPGYEGRHWVSVMPIMRGLLSNANSPLA